MTRAQDEGCARVSEWSAGMIMRKVTSDDPYTRASKREETQEHRRSRLPKKRTLQSQHPLTLCFDVSIYLPPSFRGSSQIDMRDTRVRVSTSACYLCRTPGTEHGPGVERDSTYSTPANWSVTLSNDLSYTYPGI